LKSRNVAEFTGTRGGKVSTDYPLAKAALVHLAGMYPKPLAFSALFEAARELIGKPKGPFSDDDAEAL